MKYILVCHTIRTGIGMLNSSITDSREIAEQPDSLIQIITFTIVCSYHHRRVKSFHLGSIGIMSFRGIEIHENTVIGNHKETPGGGTRTLNEMSLIILTIIDP